MATEVGSAFVSIMPSAKGFGRALGKTVDSEADSSGRRGGRTFGTAFARTGVGPIKAGFGTIGKAATGIFAGLAVGNVFKGFIDDARESAKVTAITGSVIKSTGGAANLTAKQVGNLATAISNKTGIDDEQIQANENVLLTFTKVRNEVGRGNQIFSRATIAAQNMATVLGTDASGASIQLGKALNDPLKGITALSRAGVSFTAQQKAQIKTLVDSGRTLDAQKIILREVGNEFGGAARAAATPMDRLRVTIGNVGESIGAQLIPWVDRGAQGLGAFIAAVQRGTATGNGFIGFMSRLGAQTRATFEYIQNVAIPAMTDLAQRVLPQAQASMASISRSVQIVAGAFRTGTGSSNQFRGSIDKATFAAKVIEAEMKVVALNVRVLAVAFRVSAAAPIFFAQVATKAFRTVVSTFLSLVGAIVNGAARAFGWIPGLGGKLQAAAGQFNAFRARVEASLAGLGGAGQRAGAQFTAGLAAGIQANGQVAVATALGVARKITAAVNSAQGFNSSSPSKKGIQSGKWLIEGVAVGIRAATATGVKAAQDMADRVSRALENRLSKATDRLSALKDKASQAFETAAGGVRGFLDISSIGQAVESQVTRNIIDPITGAVSQVTEQISSIPSAATLFQGFAGNAKAFAAAIQQMAAKKFPVSLIAQVAGSGNLAAAQTLAGLNPADTAIVTQATRDITTAANKAGTTLQTITVDPKLIVAAQKQVTQLSAQSKQLDAIMKRLQSLDEKQVTATATIRAGDLAVAIAREQKKNKGR